MDYQVADSKLQGRNALSRKIANNTYLQRRKATDPLYKGTQGAIAVKLHDTDVVTFYKNGDVELNSGGWRTVTTKARINEYLNHGYYVNQERGQWYLGHYSGEGKHERLGVFEDGLTIKADGTIEGMSPVEEATRLLSLRRKVNRFAAKYAEAFGKGEVPKPGAGDCFFCGMRTQEGQTLGESVKDKDHLLRHIEENYFVPSILARAMTETPTSIAFKQSVWAVWEKSDQTFFKQNDPWFLSQVKKAVSRYMLRQLGQAA